MKYLLLLLALIQPAFANYEPGLPNQVYRIGASGGKGVYGAIDISQFAAIGASILSTTNGGFGLNLSSSTGAPYIVSGAWTIGSALPTIYGGTEVTSSGVNGNILQSNGTKWISAPLTAAFTAPTIQKFLSTGTTTGAFFTVSSANATAGATYTNNTQTFTVLQTISSATQLFTSGTGTPLTSGTLTKSGGTGDTTITFSSTQPLATYTTHTGPTPLYLKIKMVGAGGSGGAYTTNGNAGGLTLFGTNVLIANGGIGGLSSSNSGAPLAGGSFTVNAPATQIYGVAGGSTGAGDSSGTIVPGSPGGNSIFGGSGGGGSLSSSGGVAAATNSGSGGGGGGGQSGGTGNGQGGAAGGGIEAIIASPAATYYYSVGLGGAAVTGTMASGAGGAGQISVEEAYQ